MIGRHLTKLLPDSYGVTHDDYDLMNKRECEEALKDGGVNEETTVYNCTGMNGGLPLNIAKPADIYYQSAQLNLNILQTCQMFNVKKVVSIISACSYPDTDHEMKEEEFLNGPPNKTVACHGHAKRTILAFGQSLNQQHGLAAISTILTNTYGPFDRFDLKRTKVVGAVVRKVCEAKENNAPHITFFGTGSPVRELIFAGDAASCLVQIANKYEDYQNPINIGSDQITSIRNLVEMVVELVGYTGEIHWDTEKPDGQAYRKLCTDKMKMYVDHKMTPFEDGLRKTIDYYLKIGRFLDR